MATKQWNNYSNASTLADADEFLVYDADGNVLVNITKADLLTDLFTNTLTASSGGEQGFDHALTVNQSGTAYYDGVSVSVTETATGDGSDDSEGIGNTLYRAKVGGSTVFAVDPDGVVVARADGSVGDLFVNDSRDGINYNGNLNFKLGGVSYATVASRSGNGAVVVQGGAARLELNGQGEKIERNGNALDLYAGSSVIVSVDSTGVTPSADNTYKSGTGSNRWSDVHTVNIHTGDLHMADKGRDADWTLREHHDWIEARNNMTGRRYRVAMEPLEDDA